ncbi:DUF6685 family protein [Paucibacter soli]|uniref:DUF6685 family protein n=1 Tax=Paucibacter soli TaxID=3133433 RepID=UPI0030A47D9A
MEFIFNPLQAIARGLWHTLSGRTANLEALSAYAKTMQALPPGFDGMTAALANVFPWHHVGNANANLLLWQPDGFGGMVASRQSPAQFAVTRQERVGHVELSIREVQGLSASKSPIENFPELDAFATAHCTDLLSDVTPQAARALLSKGNVRLWVEGLEPKAPPDNFVWHQWDERFFFSNCDGSHHFAAARWIALQTRTDIKVGAQLTMHTINMAAVINLVNQYDIFFVGFPEPADDSDALVSCRAPETELHELMSRLQTPWAYLSLPWSAPDGFLLILPKAFERSREVAQVLRSAGLTDAGHLLSVAALNQVPMFPSALAQAA